MSANRSDRDHVPTSGIEPSHHDRSQRQRLYRYYSTPVLPLTVDREEYLVKVTVPPGSMAPTAWRCPLLAQILGHR
jgi:hypothetical protein